MHITTTSQDCGSGSTDGPPITKERAINILLSRVQPVGETETIATIDGLGRVLAAPLISGIDVPIWDNSAMDGYALRCSDVAEYGGRLRVTQTIPAGAVGVALAAGTAARIFTGAPVPDGADTVVIQEICESSGGQVLVPGDCKRAANIRRAGEDIRAGSVVIPAGTRLAPQHLGLAASIGFARLRVNRRLRVAVVCTGDELAMPDQALGSAQIYNSNRFTLFGLLQGFGCDIVDLGTVPDSLTASMEALARGAREADLVLASGGVSAGGADHIKTAVRRLGTLDLWNVAIRPGKPLAFGRIGRTPFFGGPGNPVSLFVTFCLFARPLLLRLQGVAGDLTPRAVQVRAGFGWPKPDRRREFHRARIQTADDGVPELVVFPHRSSAVLSSVAWADGLVEISEGQVIRLGDLVDFLPLEHLLR